MISDYYQNLTLIKVTKIKMQGGGLSESKTGSTIKGDIQSIKGNKILINDKIVIDSTHRLYCDIIDIDENDRVKDANRTYQVMYVANIRNHHLEVDLKCLT